jgi:hypothetical protein
MKVIEIIEGLSVKEKLPTEIMKQHVQDEIDAEKAKKAQAGQGSMMGKYYDKQTRGWAQGGKTGGRWMVDPDAAGKTPVITEPTNLKPRTGSSI